MNTHEQTERVQTNTSAATAARRRGRPRIFAILAALGGRYGWRWWMPLAVWSGIATASRLQANANLSVFPLLTGAYETLTIATLVALLIIWISGSRLAVSFGHRRGHVFALASITTLGMVVGAQLLAEIADRIEHAVVGRGAVRVMAIHVPGVSESGGEPVPSPLFNTLLSWTMTDLTYLMPIATALVVMVCWQMRWSWRGLLPGLLLVPVAFLGHFQIWAVLEGIARGPRQDLLAGGFALGITVSVLLALAWLAFRRAPV